MDLTQNKLSKSEWMTIEVSVPENEKQIIKLIMDGYHNVNIHTNENQSMYSFIKIEQNPETEYLLYKKYFQEQIQEIIKKYGKNTPLEKYIDSNNGGELKHMKSADMIRIQNLETNIKENKKFIFEFLILDLCGDLLKQISKRKQKYAFYLYTIVQLKKVSIHNINKHVLSFLELATNYANSLTKTSEIITNAYEFIECNKYLLKYEDHVLFKHQKELFTICKDSNKFVPKLILYTAPTGTGKTLSPIGLSENYRVIFVCVARHIGLALAKSAISVEKKVAFAFGCTTASDIRLHYFSAINYTRNKRSGGIGKVDNSQGDNVEIMICDVQSYITAMYYMLAFNPAEKIITFWDEPTITLDYEEHPLHKTIHENWQKNTIPTMILSCATLPTQEELHPIFNDFRLKFDEAEIHTITSYDCRKSIPILNKNGECVLPHYLYSEYKELYNCVKYCEKNKTLLRYFDLREIINFIEYINDNDFINERYSIDNYFNGNIAEITMNSLKEYYLIVLLNLDFEKWSEIYQTMKIGKKRKYGGENIRKTMSTDTNSRTDSNIFRTNSLNSVSNKKPSQINSAANGILLTTSDAYTLTDGPTIFLADDVNKIGTFYIQQSNIDSNVFKNILSKIIKNGEILKRIEQLDGQIEILESKTTTNKEGEKEKSSARESGRLCKESEKMMEEINKIRKEIKLVSLDPQYVPNTKPHQELWTPTKEVYENAFVSNIGEDMAKEIMLLDIENNLKVLLLLGIGMFSQNITNSKYIEIMKVLADEQRLFIIIASTDYIYGTNYQFCHGFIGKDLTRMTQQKTLQAMGRIGRNNIQQDYTIRFRDDEMIAQLFKKPDVNLEAHNMCVLFCSD
jgi:hypothetical protein